MGKSCVGRLSGKTVALLSAEGVHEHEFWVPYYRFGEEGARVLVCGREAGVVHRGEGRHGTGGLDLAPTEAAVADLEADAIDALIIPSASMARSRCAPTSRRSSWCAPWTSAARSSGPSATASGCW